MIDFITRDRLKKLLFYDPDTGIFLWETRTGKRGKPGEVAGCVINITGYIQIRIDSKNYFAHRLAWFYMTGKWPTYMIDHINDDNNPESVNRADNRWCNLREVDNRGNQSNRKIHREGRLVGAYYNKIKQKWVSQIGIDGKRKHLGYYETEQEASDVYQKALTELNKIKESKNEYRL